MSFSMIAAVAALGGLLFGVGRHRRDLGALLLSEMSCIWSTTTEGWWWSRSASGCGDRCRDGGAGLCTGLADCG